MQPKHLTRVAVLMSMLLILGISRTRSTETPTLIEYSDVSSAHQTIANPAATYCGSLGFSYQIVGGENGGDTGLCIMPNGEECEAWDFLAGKCGEEFSYCSQLGYAIKTMHDGKNAFSQEYAICLNEKGQEVGSVTELFNLSEKAANCGGKGSETPNQGGGIGNNRSSEKESELQESLLGEYTTLPEAFDWRNVNSGNWLTPIRDQGGCGSCWAFSAVGAVEAAINIAHNDPNLDINLSEEYLVSDCSIVSGYQNCCGGWNSEALRFIQSQGIPDESCMPYVDGAYPTGCYCDFFNSCSTDCAYRGAGQCSDTTCTDRCSDYANRLIKISRTEPVTGTREDFKQALVTYGPLSASMNMGGDFWDDGIYRCNDDVYTNHDVVIVGYDNSGDYWIVRNSWGTDWDSGGYFKVGYGECGIEYWAPFYASIDCFTLTTTDNPANAGIVDVSPSPNCFGGKYRTGTVVTLNAIPSIEYQFSKWSGAVTGSTNPINLTINGDKSVTANFETLPIPSTPRLRFPANNSLSTIYTLTLNWDDSAPGFDHYQLQLDNDIDFNSPIIDKSDIKDSEHQIANPLPENTQYYWRVQAFNLANKTNGWSTVWTFRTAILPPALNSPLNTEILNNKRPTFIWHPVTGASGYTVEVSTNSIFSSKKINASVSIDSYTAIKDLSANTLYYWRVKANGLNGPSAYSDVWTFTTGNPPSVPSLSKPSKNALVNLRPFFDWKDSKLPTSTTLRGYQIQVSTSSGFDSTVIDEGAVAPYITASAFTPTADLSPATTYYWRVRSWNTNGDYSGWSLIRSFRTAYVAPILIDPSGAIATLRPMFTWNAVAGATSYKIQVSTSSTLSRPVVNVTVYTNSYTMTKDLLPAKTYYWRVQALGAYGPGPWSLVFTITTP